MKNDWSIALKEKLQNAKKLVILGVGAELMQDDLAGPTVTQALIKKYGEINNHLRIYSGYTNPENFTKDIREFEPDHVVIVDAANLNQVPGSIHDVPIEDINNYTLGTHKLSLIIMMKYLKEMIRCDFTFMAIQYKSIEFNGNMTQEAKVGVKQMIKTLSGIIEASFLKF